MYSNWSPDEDGFIRMNAGRLSDADMAAKLTLRFGRPVTRDAARKRRQRLGVAKLPGRGVCETKD